MIEWTEIKIKVPNRYLEAAGDIAQMAVPYGIYIEDYSALEQEVEEIAHIDLIDEELLKKDRTKGIVHIYINPDESPQEAVAFLSERYTSEGIEHEIELASCIEEDWLNNWKKYFNPIPIGEKLLIRPTWRDEYDSQGRAVINLDPGLAFGTGTHETTRLVLQTIEKYVKAGAILFEDGVLRIPVTDMPITEENIPSSLVEKAFIKDVDEKFRDMLVEYLEKKQEHIRGM